MKTFENVAKLKLAKLKEGQFVETGGYYAKGDAGAARYLIVAPQAADGYGDHVLANGNVAVLQVEGEINVKQLGAKGDGLGDETSAIQAALDQWNDVYFPNGTYNVTTLIKSTSGRVTGESRDGAIIKGISTVAGAAAFECRGADPTQLSDLSTDVFAGGKVLPMVSAPDVTTNDLVMLVDEVNGSWLAARDVYKKGEMCLVKDVSSLDIELITPLVDGYDAVHNAGVAEVDVYKLNNISVSISNISVEKSDDPAGVMKGLMLYWCRDSVIDNVSAYGGDHIALGIKHSYNVTVTASLVTDDWSLPIVGTNYGVAVSNAQNVTVRDCQLIGQRHGFTSGGGADYAIPCRYVTVDNCTLNSVSLQSLDMHGNAEFFSFINNYIENGIVLGGDNHIISGNHMHGTVSNGSAILFAEILGTNYHISNNKVLMDITDTLSGRGFFVDSETLADVTRDGVCTINNNIVEIDDSGNTNNDLKVIRLYTVASSTSANLLSFVINNNHIKTKAVGNKARTINVRDLSPIDTTQVLIQGNNLINCGIEVQGRVVDSSVMDNVINGANPYGIYGNYLICDEFSVSGNSVSNVGFTPLLAEGSDATSMKILKVTNNSFTNSNINDAGASSVNSSVFMGNVVQAMYFGNFTGSPGSFQARDYHCSGTELNIGSNVLITGSSATVSGSPTTVNVI